MFFNQQELLFLSKKRRCFISPVFTSYSNIDKKKLMQKHGINPIFLVVMTKVLLGST